MANKQQSRRMWQPWLSEHETSVVENQITEKNSPHVKNSEPIQDSIWQRNNKADVAHRISKYCNGKGTKKEDKSIQTLVASTSKSVKAHKRLSIQKKFHCKFCGARFIHERGLDIHFGMMHSNIDCYNCDNCQKSFAWRGHLKTHVCFQNNKIDSSHSQEVSHFMCYYCGEALTSARDLSDHIETLHLDQMAICKFCGYKFLNNTDLQGHIVTEHILSLR